MIDRIGSALSGAAGGTVSGVSGVGGDAPSFAESLEKAVESVNREQNEGDGMLVGLAAGEHTDLHGTMIALEEANIALRAMASARDKVVEAYQTIWNMQV